MDERKFLDKIRKMQSAGKKIKLTEMKDINKDKENMINEWEDAGLSGLDVLTEDGYDPNFGMKRKIIKEEEIIIDDNPDVQNVDADEQREEENKFKDIVSKLVKFGKIKVHKQNVEWSGHLIREKVDWVFSLDDTVGCYIDTTDFMQLRDESLEVLKKLRGYYDVWSDEWSGRLTGTPMDDEEEDVDMGEVGDEANFGDEGGNDFGGEEGGTEFNF